MGQTLESLHFVENLQGERWRSSLVVEKLAGGVLESLLVVEEIYWASTQVIARGERLESRSQKYYGQIF